MSSHAIKNSQLGMLTPRIASGAVVRTKLLDRLKQMAPIMILEGLPGSGRTTLAVQWINQFFEPWQKIWVDGNSLSTKHDLAQLLGKIKSQLANEKIVVVIDDFPLLFDQETITLIDEQINSCSNLHLMMCANPANAISRWRKWGRIEAQILGQNDLDIAVEELSTFVESWGHSADTETQTKLHAAFLGWLRPTRYALDIGDGHIEETQFPQTKWQIRRGIVEKIGNPDTNYVVQALAVTDAVTADLLEILLQQTDPGRKILSATAAGNLLATMESQGLIERSKLLVSVPAWQIVEPLQETLCNTSEEELDNTEAHKHIVRYWMNSPYKRAAMPLIMKHARAGKIWGVLESLWKEYGTEIFRDEKRSIEAYRLIPQTVGRQYPWLWAISRMVTALSQPEIALRGSLVSEEPTQIVDEAAFTNRLRDPNVELVLATETVAEMRRASSAAAATELAQKKYAAYSAVTGKHNTREGLSFLAWFELEWALAAVADRRKKAAFQLFKRALEHAKLSQLNFLVDYIAARLALHTQVIGYTSEADQLMELVSQEGKIVTLLGAQPNYLLTEAMRRLGEFDGDGVEENLSKLSKLGERFEQWPLIVLTKTQHALLFGDQGSVLVEIARTQTVFADQLQSSGRNRTILARCAADLLMSLGELHRARQVVEGPEGEEPEMMVAKSRVALLSGDVDGARTVAQAGIWGGQPVVRDQIELLLIEATASLQAGDTAAAAKSYVQAKAATIELGSRMSLMMFPDEILQKLETIAGTNDDFFIRRPMGIREIVYPTQGSLVTLTSRERKVLVEMEKCPTLMQVAENLSVSLNTVKKQSISIYQKLGVHSRADAIKAASRLGLLAQE